ncbi:hypothetical protein DFR58_1489 [Anaerobacterium chartisolvens]|uniref:Uncharacterized protein n=1 Tax=Anaerobacterium chartisolvens TaxID=1297424 RepID=A0A369AFI6_9FIRM|nr:hypothetical protein [Anaerobacterium chartisolvens]RCX07875.1 hypothetical protein DFR58_1489 [Anaerobacterium chartisolvens]
MSMNMNIIFINPNEEEDAEKYLPKVLAQSVISKIMRDAFEISDTYAPTTHTA